MKVLMTFIVALMATASANALEVYIGQDWQSIGHCGGDTRVTCDNVDNACSTNRCHIEFRNSYGCNTIKLNVADNWYPDYNTSDSMPLAGSFYIDHSKLRYDGTYYLKVFIDQNNQGTDGAYERVTYHLSYCQ